MRRTEVRWPGGVCCSPRLRPRACRKGMLLLNASSRLRNTSWTSDHSSPAGRSCVPAGAQGDRHGAIRYAGMSPDRLPEQAAIVNCPSLSVQTCRLCTTPIPSPSARPRPGCLPQPRYNACTRSAIFHWAKSLPSAAPPLQAGGDASTHAAAPKPRTAPAAVRPPVCTRLTRAGAAVSVAPVMRCPQAAGAPKQPAGRGGAAGLVDIEDEPLLADDQMAAAFAAVVGEVGVHVGNVCGAHGNGADASFSHAVATLASRARR